MIVRRDKLFDIFQYAILFLLFLMAMDFKNKVFYLAFGAFGLISLYDTKRLQLPKCVIPGVVLAVSMALFAPSARNSYVAGIRPFTYPFCILIGYNLTNATKRAKMEKQVISIIIVLAAGSFCHYLLNMISNWGIQSERNMYDIWLKSVRSATGQATLSCLMVGVTSAVLFCNVRLILKLCAIAVSGSIVVYNLQLAGRTLLLFIGISLLLAFSMRCFIEKSGIVKLRMICVVVAVIILVYILVSVNAFGIVDQFSQSNFYDRFFGEYSDENLSGDGRLAKKINYLVHMWDYPFGGGYLRKAYGNAHDVILDTYDEAGLFAMISIVIMLCSDLNRCFRVFVGRNVDGNTKIVLSTVLGIIMLQFMLEPVLLGMEWLFACYCVIHGSLARLNEVV